MHSFVLVLVPAGSPDLEAAARTLLARHFLDAPEASGIGMGSVSIGGAFNGRLTGNEQPAVNSFQQPDLEINTRPVASLLAGEAPTWQELGGGGDLVTPDGQWHDSSSFVVPAQRWPLGREVWLAHTWGLLEQHASCIIVGFDAHS